MADTLPIKQIVEGAIMASEHPVTIDQLRQLFEGEQPARADIQAALKEIQQACEGRGYELKAVASGYRFQVRAEYGEWVARLWKERPARYSRALLETLALVAYKQPLTRGDIEAIRGVAVSTNIMRSLLEREWVRVVGHRDVPGHPALYATTSTFLDYFNLAGLDELPSLAEIKDMTRVNEELDLAEEPLESRSLEMDEMDREAVAGLDDTDLDEVSQMVNNIQENVRGFVGDGEDDEAVDTADGEAVNDHADAHSDRGTAKDDDKEPGEEERFYDDAGQSAPHLAVVPATRTATVTPIASLRGKPGGKPREDTDAGDEDAH